MAATVELREWNGVAPGSPTDKTFGTILFQNLDTAVVSLDYPISTPIGSTPSRSYEKWVRLYIGVTPPIGGIINARTYSDGGNGFGTGLDLFAGVAGSYSQPIKTDSAIATVDYFSYEDGGTELDMSSINTGPYSAPETDIADFLVLQADIYKTASPGLTPSELLVIAYDET